MSGDLAQADQEAAAKREESGKLKAIDDDGQEWAVRTIAVQVTRRGGRDTSVRGGAACGAGAD